MEEENLISQEGLPAGAKTEETALPKYDELPFKERWRLGREFQKLNPYRAVSKLLNVTMLLCCLPAVVLFFISFSDIFENPPRFDLRFAISITLMHFSALFFSLFIWLTEKGSRKWLEKEEYSHPPKKAMSKPLRIISVAAAVVFCAGLSLQVTGLVLAISPADSPFSLYRLGIHVSMISMGFICIRSLVRKESFNMLDTYDLWLEKKKGLTKGEGPDNDK
ncbi:MAG: hypothetical protein FWC82_02865 [Firmicutes bacterium]|nr:hypothetical protein [Bacillota bacterium]